MRLESGQKYREWLLCAALFFLPHAVFSGLFQTPYHEDFFSAHGLLLRFLYYVKAGYFPLWSPLMHGGMPGAYELSMTGGLSPIYWLFYARFPSVYTGNSLILFLHIKLFILGLGGVGAFYCFKKLSGSFWGALLGALAFILNARMMDNLRYMAPLDILCYLPFLFLFAEGLAEKPGSFYGILYSLFLGLMFLTGQAQHGLFNLLLLGSYFLARVIWIKKEPSPGKTILRILEFGVFSVLGMFLAAPLLLPLAIDALGQLGQRVSQAASWTDAYSMSFASLAANFGFPWLADIHSAFYGSMASAILLLISLAILCRRGLLEGEKKRLFAFFWIFFVFCLLYSLGSKTGVSAWIGKIIPPLKFTRAPGRIMGIGVFCLSALVAMTAGFIETLDKNNSGAKRFFKKTLWLILAGLAAACVLSFRLKNAPLSAVLDPYTPLTLGGYAITTQVYGFILFSLLSFAGICLLTGNGRRQFMIGCLFLAGLMIAEARAYQPPPSWKPLNEKIITYNEFISMDTFHLRTMAFQPIGQNWPLGPGNEIQIDAPKALGQFLIDGDYNAKKLFADLGKGQAYFTENYAVVTDLRKALGAMAVPTDFRKITVIDRKDAPDLISQIPAAKNPPEIYPPAEISVIKLTPNTLQLRVNAPTAGIVNYLTNYHPAFRASVDGKPVSVLKTFGTFIGVPCPAGQHRITIDYDPLSVKMASALFGLSAAFLLGWGFRKYFLNFSRDL